jgi:hypothetical protein
MQLVAYGAQDVYITGNPQITFFKVVYRRHTNFSVEVVEHPLTNAGFGRRASVTVLRNGDLATKMYLKTQVSGTGGSSWGFVSKLGHALIKNVELEIGGSKIDKQYGVWMDIWYELSHEVGQEAGYNQMIGNTAAMTTRSDAEKSATLYIPLQFWFCRNTGLALPLIALQYHEVRVHFEFNNASELTRHVAAPTLTMDTAELLVDYVFLDSEERRRFAQVGHEYLIEQLQFTGEESANANAEKYKLSFNHPTKELVWAVRQGKFMGQTFLGETLDEVAKALVASCYATVNTAAVTGTWAAVGTDANHICIDDDWIAAGGQTRQCQALGVNAGTNTAAEQVHVLNGTTNLLSLIDYSTTLVSSTGAITVTSVAHRLTVELISTALSDLTDERTTVAKVQALLDAVVPGTVVTAVGSEEGTGVVVNQWDNYGMNLDGTGNPVERALIQLNGHDRFDEQEGDYFNYVQPWQHHTNTPPAGVNVYSFSLAPEQHQPQGSANLSRIDNTQLNVTLRAGGRAADNRMYIFAFSYNVLRIMSGMGGLAYSN